MKKMDDIPLSEYTDNVRIIVMDPLREYYGDGAWAAIENPATPLEDLENALKILEGKNEPADKRRIEKIKKEIEMRESAQKEKGRWWYPFRSEKEGRDFVRRWNEATRIIKEKKRQGEWKEKVLGDFMKNSKGERL